MDKNFTLRTEKADTQYFVPQASVVRQIWGKSDTVLLIFAGAAAEFALNKSVDWLYFTGRLPEDPLGRLFTTVAYAKRIVFSEKEAALRTIDTMNHIHQVVVEKRGARIPQEAFRDVLYMLIDYSIRAFEILERRLSRHEKQEVFEVFHQVGGGMQIEALPATFEQWTKSRQEHMEKHLRLSTYTKDLFDRYRQHLGGLRYRLLIEAQKMLLPETVKQRLGLGKTTLLKPLVRVYKLSRQIGADEVLKALILPGAYKDQIAGLDNASSHRPGRNIYKKPEPPYGESRHIATTP